MLIENQSLYLNQSLAKIEMPGEKLVGYEFDNCTFQNCNFSDAEFLKCKFFECHFIHCNLSMINVKNSSFFDVLLENSKAIGINWTQADWPSVKISSHLRFNKCILNSSTFFGLDLREIEIIECSAKEVDFREADCAEANFSYTDFANSLFGKTNLTKANFTDAVNYHIDILNNEIKKAKFSLPEAANLLNGLDIELV